MATKPDYGSINLRQHLGLFQDVLTSLFDRNPVKLSDNDDRPVEVLCRELLTSKGEVSGFRIAKSILDRLNDSSEDELLEFFHFLADELDVDADKIESAIKLYRQERNADNLASLVDAAEPVRQELLRRLNQVTGATSNLVQLREKILGFSKDDNNLKRVDLDFQHLFSSWFNRGFLVMSRIDWQSPADILEKIIQYEAVHEIDDWDDLRRRLQPEDRRCYGFFHPSMPNEPLIFVEVALSNQTPDSIQSILSEDREVIDQNQATSAIFYSISNCQKGLHGISFGNFLIKQVVKELASELPGIKKFITLSPLPGFGRWLQQQDDQVLRNSGEHEPDQENLREKAAKYLVKAKSTNGLPVDPVARFHLNNGALIYDVHADADISEKGMRQSAGVMVNYLYDLKKIEKNHESFASHQKINVSKNIKHLLASTTKFTEE